jgi:hypothetical protein
MEVAQLNLSHQIHKLQFGAWYPGQENPLDGYWSVKMEEWDVGGKFNYFVKIVPTQYEGDPLAGTIETNQYSVTEHYAPRPGSASNSSNGGGFIPGVFILYDMSPIRVRVYQQRPYASVVHFTLEMCSICGGVFTVLGIVDAVWHRSLRDLRLKMAMGKAS